jgi:hypothetical protein
MNVVHAVWEQRNMGVDCWEVEIEQDDNTEEFESRRAEFESEYTVVKVPSTMPEFGFYLQERGYRYVETMISLNRDTTIPELDRIQKRVIAEMTYTQMSDADLDVLSDEIRAGMFTTDRVCIDPEFTREQAHNRYICWIQDEINLGATIYNILYKNKTVGFFMMREKKNGVAYTALAGIYQNVKIVGVGTVMDYFEIVEAARRGSKKVSIAVSTNNIGALRIPVQLGYSVERFQTVYIKHGRKSDGTLGQ